jgi:hypothetical protein
LQDIKTRILNLALRVELRSHLYPEEIESIDSTVKLIDMIQDQSVDHPDNKYTKKQVYGFFGS